MHKQPTLLIVDDYKANRLVLQKQLANNGFDFLMAESGRQALELLEREHIDLILLDIMMPDIDGIEVLKRIKASKRLHDIPVIMVTAMEEDSALPECLKLGASDYVTKPLKMPILRARVASQLSRKWAMDAVQESRLNLTRKVEERTRDLQLALSQREQGLKEQAKAKAEAQQARLRLRDAIEALADGFALFDTDMKLEMANSKFHAFYGDGGRVAAGQSYASILRSVVDKGLIPEAQGQEDAWIEQQLDLLELERDVQMTDERWLRVAQRRTSEGGLVGIFSDITERKNMEDRLRLAALIDPLTGLYNRRHFLTALDGEVNRWKRYQGSLSLIMIDIDFFKSVNDKHGHNIGDQVLCALSETLGDILRSSDTLARWGGEEFIALLPNTPITDTRMLAERICAVVAATDFSTDAGKLRITISAGIAGISAEMETVEQFIKAADGALYRAKAAGRNRMCAA